MGFTKEKNMLMETVERTKPVTVTIGRIREAAKVGEFAKHFVLEEDQSAGEFLQVIQGVMTTTPEKIQVLRASRDGETIAFAISFDLARPHVWIAQFWSAKETSTKVSDELFLRILNWAIALGKEEIRAETKRSVEAFYRRVGFTQHAVTVKLELKGIESKMLDRSREVFKDG